MQVQAFTPYGYLCKSPDQMLGFNGQFHDNYLGGYLLGQGYRCYNPTLMRLHSPDDISPFGMGGMNAYAYCSADPVNSIDPSGHAGSGLPTPPKTLTAGRKPRVVHQVVVALERRAINVERAAQRNRILLERTEKALILKRENLSNLRRALGVSDDIQAARETRPTFLALLAQASKEESSSPQPINSEARPTTDFMQLMRTAKQQNTGTPSTSKTSVAEIRES